MDQTPRPELEQMLHTMINEMRNTSAIQQQQLIDFNVIFKNQADQISTASHQISTLQSVVQNLSENLQEMSSRNQSRHPSPAPPVQATPQTLVGNPGLRETFKSDYKLVTKFSGNQDVKEIIDWKFSVENYLNLFPDLQPATAKYFISARFEGPALTWYQHLIKRQAVSYTHLTLPTSP
jgi:hypothetical protein